MFDADIEESLAKNSREILVGAFTRCVPHSIYNMAHLVLDDKNLDSDSIVFALDWIGEHGEEYLHDHRGVAWHHVAMIVSFLRLLQEFPEPLEDNE